MKTLTKNITRIETRYFRLALAVAALVLCLWASIWLLKNFWPGLVLSSAGIGAWWYCLKARKGIRIADGITLSEHAFKTYLRESTEDLGCNFDPEISIRGWGNNIVILLKVDFPADPGEAAEFHANVIYVKGFLGRKIADDFKIDAPEIEIEARCPIATVKKVYR